MIGKPLQVLMTCLAGAVVIAIVAFTIWDALS